MIIVSLSSVEFFIQCIERFHTESFEMKTKICILLSQEEEQDGLMKQFSELKTQLVNVEDLRLIEPNVFLAPFLEVIRSEETTGQITSLALSALNKFLSYGLIGECSTQPKFPLNSENRFIS